MSGVDIEGLDELRRATAETATALEREVAAASDRIARRAAQLIAAAARTAPERKAAGSIRARGGVPPAIIGGGGSSDAAQMFFGTEFGGRGSVETQQFRPYGGTQGYWFYPTLRRHGRALAELWLDAIDDATSEWRNR